MATTHIPTANILATHLVDTLETTPAATGGSGRAGKVGESRNGYVVDATKTIGLGIGDQAGVVATWTPFNVSLSGYDSYTKSLRSLYVTSLMRVGVQYAKEASCARIILGS